MAKRISHAHLSSLDSAMIDHNQKLAAEALQSLQKHSQGIQDWHRHWINTMTNIAWQTKKGEHVIFDKIRIIEGEAHSLTSRMFYDPVTYVAYEERLIYGSG